MFQKWIRVLIYSYIVVNLTTGCSSSSDSNSDTEQDSTDQDDDPADVSPAESFDFSGAKAVGRFESATGECNLVKLQLDGLVVQACMGTVVTGFRLFRGGAWVQTSDGRNLLVLEGQTVTAGGGMLAGQNSMDDLFFDDLRVFRMGSLTFDRINTTLANPGVIHMSGDFLAWDDAEAGIAQVYDTITGLRYNINRCNGPAIAALSSTVVAINDCSAGQEIMNMTDGTRGASAISYFNHEHLPLISSGAVFLSQSCPPASGGYYLCHVNASGAVTSLLTAAVSPGSGDCMNCLDGNTVLFGTSGFFAIRELSQISVIVNGIDAKNVVLSGLNVIAMDVLGSTLYYSAEDSLGAPIVGTVDLSGLLDTPIPSEVLLTSIQAVP